MTDEEDYIDHISVRMAAIAGLHQQADQLAGEIIQAMSILDGEFQQELFDTLCNKMTESTRFAAQAGCWISGNRKVMNDMLAAGQAEIDQENALFKTRVLARIAKYER